VEAEVEVEVEVEVEGVVGGEINKGRSTRYGYRRRDGCSPGIVSDGCIKTPLTSSSSVHLPVCGFVSVTAVYG
jgi:hypothetical protein